MKFCTAVSNEKSAGVRKKRFIGAAREGKREKGKGGGRN